VLIFRFLCIVNPALLSGPHKFTMSGLLSQAAKLCLAHSSAGRFFQAEPVPRWEIETSGGRCTDRELDRCTDRPSQVGNCACITRGRARYAGVPYGILGRKMINMQRCLWTNYLHRIIYVPGSIEGSPGDIIAALLTPTV
jgi:hypothetical protein